MEYSEAACAYCCANLGGYAGCQALFNQMTAQAFSDVNYFAQHRLVVDCYSLQHPEFYCASAKSYVAHLTGLCAAIDYENKNEIDITVRRWLDGKVEMDKLKVLAPCSRGTRTITHLQSASNPLEHKKLVYEWARNIWQAYSELHDAAQTFIAAAMRLRE